MRDKKIKEHDYLILVGGGASFRKTKVIHGKCMVFDCGEKETFRKMWKKNIFALVSFEVQVLFLFVQMLWWRSRLVMNYFPTFYQFGTKTLKSVYNFIECLFVVSNNVMVYLM